MTRNALLMLVATLILSSAVALDAQRRGGGGGAVAGGGGRTGGARAGSGGARDGGSGVRVQVHVPPASIPRSAGMSISRPIGTAITGVQTNPPPGFGPRRRSPFAARPGMYTQLLPFGSYAYGYGYGYDVPGYGEPESTYEKLYRTPEPVITEGMLYLDVTPPTAQVFIDSAYVGNVAEVQTRGLTLAGGRHWVDLEAPNYDRKTVEVTVTPGEPLRYRYDMTAERPAQTVAAPPAAPQTMYTIAGCYAGNRPPSAANLPNGCDIRKVRVVRPTAR